MITIEVTQTPDQVMLGQHKVFFDTFILGTSKKSDLVFEDDQMSSRHVKLEVTSDGLLCSSVNERDFYLSNSKKVLGKKLHQKNDSIQIGTTTFKVVDFAETDPSKVPLDEKYEKLIQENPKIRPLMEQLEKELLLAEREENAR